MKKFPFPDLALRPGPQVALLALIAALPGPALAQKLVPPPRAVPSAASAPSLGLSLKEALSQKQMLDADTRLDRPVFLDVISVPLDEVLQKGKRQQKRGRQARH